MDLRYFLSKRLIARNYQVLPQSNKVNYFCRNIATEKLTESDVFRYGARRD